MQPQLVTQTGTMTFQTADIQNCTESGAIKNTHNNTAISSVEAQ